MNLFKKNHLIVACLCVVSVGQLLAQKVSKFVYKADNTVGKWEEIVFYDIATGRQTKTFDISQNNPYGNLPFPFVVKNKEKVYDLSKLPKESYNLFLSDKYVSNEDIKSDSVLVDKILNWAELSYENATENFIVVSYNLAAYKNNFPVSFKSSLNILDNKGNSVKSLKNLNTETRFPVITQNGKFLLLNYGGELDCSNNELLPRTFKIIDIDSGETIHEETYDFERIKDKKEFGTFTSEGVIPICINNMFVVVSKCTERKNTYLYQIFDPEKKKIYIKKCNYYIFNDEIKKDGFYHEKDKMLFEKDFLTMNFQN